MLSISFVFSIFYWTWPQKLEHAEHFPCCSRMLAGKAPKLSVCSPFSCAPNAIRTSTWNPCPEILAGKTRGKWQTDPILSTYRLGIRMCVPVQCFSALLALATVLSHTGDIPFLLKHDQIMRDNRLKHDQIMRDNRLPVQCRRVASRRHGTVIAVTTHMSLR